MLKDRLEGLGWFAHETLSRIVKNHPEHEFIFIFDRDWDESFIYGPNVTAVKTIVPSRHPFLWFWHYEIGIPRILKKYKPDLFFSPDGWMSLCTKVPTLNAIHDINFIHRPGDSPFLVRRYYNYFFPRFAHKAKRIVTVSEYSKKDLVKTLKVDAQKIDVAYNGCNPIFTSLSLEVKKEVRNKFTNGCSYFIYVGSRSPRKNISGLLDAFEKFKAGDEKNMKLMFVGEPMWNASYLSDKLENMKYKKDIVFTGRLSTEVLQMVLASAEALMLVSFYEGFGIPIIEAMYSDVPVICSNVTSLPEVAGEAALFIDPNSTDQIAGAMRQIALYPELQKSLILKGQKQRQTFSWDNTAEQVWRSIEKVLQNS